MTVDVESFGQDDARLLGQKQLVVALAEVEVELVEEAFLSRLLVVVGHLDVFKKLATVKVPEIRIKEFNHVFQK